MRGVWNGSIPQAVHLMVPVQTPPARDTVARDTVARDTVARPPRRVTTSSPLSAANRPTDPPSDPESEGEAPPAEAGEEDATSERTTDVGVDDEDLAPYPTPTRATATKQPAEELASGGAVGGFRPARVALDSPLQSETSADNHAYGPTTPDLIGDDTHNIRVARYYSYYSTYYRLHTEYNMRVAPFAQWHIIHDVYRLLDTGCLIPAVELTAGCWLSTADCRPLTADY